MVTAFPGPRPARHRGGVDSPEPTPQRGPLLLASSALGLLLAAVWATLAAGSPNQAGWRLMALLALCWLAFAVAAAALYRVPGRAAVMLLLVGAVALQAIAVWFPPRSTDDYFRYAWDGRVQAAGIDPYRHVPVDPALARLRDDWLFPPACRAADPPCTRMNHPADPTIYPPIAEAEFLAVHVVTRPLGVSGGRDRTWQLLGALLALATTGTLLRALRRRGDARHAVLWAWCPTVVLECGNNGHVDALAALLVVLALAAAAAGRPGRAGLAIGAAIGTKVLPLLVVPALLAAPRRGRTARAARLLGVAAAVLATGYLPHVIAVGARVAGFLPGYLSEEGYDGHSRYALLRPLLPNTLAAITVAAAITGVALAVARRTDPARPWQGAVVLVGLAFSLGGVSYPWYALLLVALVALDGRWEWLAVAAAGYPGYLTAPLHLSWSGTQRIDYGAALGAVLLVHLTRRRRRHRTLPRWHGSSLAGAEPEPRTGPGTSTGPGDAGTGGEHEAPVSPGIHRDSDASQR